MSADWNLLKPPPGSPHELVYNETVNCDEYRLTDLVATGEQIRTVIDLGGNVGFFAIKVAETFPDAHVHSFEPDPANIAEFQRHLALCPSLVERVILHRGGVWSETGTVTLNSGLAGVSWVEHGDGRPAQPEQTEIPVLSLDDILEEFDEVDLLKVDIEGAEYEVFGAVSLSQLAKVRHIAMEVHWWDGQDPEDQVRFLDFVESLFRIETTFDFWSSGMLYGTRRG